MHTRNQSKNQTDRQTLVQDYEYIATNSFRDENSNQHYLIWKSMIVSLFMRKIHKNNLLCTYNATPSKFIECFYFSI